MSHLLSGLPALLREAGLSVTVADDARTNRLRDSNLVDVRGVVVHTTETADKTFESGADAPTWSYVRHGRDYGPTYHLLIGRTGRVYVATFGQGGHAGTGRWPNPAAGIPDDCANLYSLGVSMDANESNFPPTPAQREALARTLYALNEEWDGELDVIMHGEYNPAGRHDPTGVDWNEVRAAGRRGWWTDPAWRPGKAPASSASSAAGPAGSAGSGVAYTIRDGDTLWSIARRLGTSAVELDRMNPGIEAGNLPIGSTLYVPAAVGHVIQPGEGFFAIARLYGVPVTDLLDLNGVDLDEEIHPGEHLVVKA